MPRKISAGLLAIFISLFAVQVVFADVGEIEICNAINPGLSTHDLPLSANTESAQVFTLTEGIVISGVKLPIQRIGSPAGTVTVRITETITNSSAIVVPDIQSGAGVLVSQSVSKLEFPEALGTSDDQVLVCSTLSGGNPGGTIVEFGSPVFLPVGSYAIVVDASSTPGNIQWGVPILNPTYAGGICSNNSNSADENDPDDWLGCYGGNTDSGFVVFNNVENPIVNDFDSWLDNFLTSINMNSPVGKLVAGSVFAGIIFFMLSAWKVPWLISLGVSGISGAVLTAAMIFDPAVLLGMIAIVGLGVIGLIFSMLGGGKE